MNSETKYSILKMLNKFKDNETHIELQDKVILSIQGKNSQQLLEDIFDVNLDSIYFAIFISYILEFVICIY